MTDQNHISDNRFYRLAIALAGIMQATDGVVHLAYTGNTNERELTTNLQAIFVLDPPDLLTVYGGQLTNLKTGFQCLRRVLHKKSDPADKENLRYLLNVLHLEKKLRRDQKKLNLIRHKLQHSQSQVEHYGLNSPELHNCLADIYLHTLGLYNFRIKITGKREFLTQAAIMAKIRSLLLSAIRSATLWRQLGGNRLHFVFANQKLITQLDRIEEQLT